MAARTMAPDKDVKNWEKPECDVSKLEGDRKKEWETAAAAFDETLAKQKEYRKQQEEWDGVLKKNHGILVDILEAHEGAPSAKRRKPEQHEPGAFCPDASGGGGAADEAIEQGLQGDGQEEKKLQEIIKEAESAAEAGVAEPGAAKASS